MHCRTTCTHGTFSRRGSSRNGNGSAAAATRQAPPQDNMGAPTHPSRPIPLGSRHHSPYPALRRSRVPLDPTNGLGIDLELGADQRLTALGAIRGDERLASPSATLPRARLAAMTAGADFVFGHNILWHDLPWLAKQAPDLPLLALPAVDSLVWSSLAFAEYPYHKLVKDYKLVRDTANDPTHDAVLARRLLEDAAQRLAHTMADDPAFGRLLHSTTVAAMATVSPAAAAGAARWLDGLCPPAGDLDAELAAWLQTRACRTAVAAFAPCAEWPADERFALPFVLAWLRVAGTAEHASPSVLPAWVRQKAQASRELVAKLRERACAAPDCVWCRAVHDAEGLLRRWFGFPGFRHEPTLPDDRPAQPAIVGAGLANTPHLALLPTGGGKSLCFQLPAIARYLRSGALTVVVSPLQSLMHDQVDNFAQKTGADFAFALTGRLTHPERREALEAVRSGRAGLLYIAPEQLRNRSVRDALRERQIGAFVFDEAHCLAKWGHDFRPDYLYAARFVRELAAQQEVVAPPITCVTATAKPEVREEIVAHFRDHIGQELEVFDGHAARDNLLLQVEACPEPQKLPRLLELLGELLVPDSQGACLVYVATRKHAADLAQRLLHAGFAAAAFHGGLEPPIKKEVQDRFLRGELRVIAATNAFGMGIDKSDIRLVVHYEVPGALENYIQEVGRAGRDGQPARAVLLFAEHDVETQFRLAAGSQLSLRDLQGVCRRVRELAKPAGDTYEAVCTTGEILRDDELAEHLPADDLAADTKVRTALAWLERGQFLRREENATSVFQGRPRVASMEEAEQKIATLNLPPHKARAWLDVLARLLAADLDDGLTSDDLLGLPGVVGAFGALPSALAGRMVLRLLRDMQAAQLLTTGVRMTAFVRHAVVDPSTARLQRALVAERALLALWQEQDPDAADGEEYVVALAATTQALVAQEVEVTPDLLRQILLAMRDRASNATERATGLRARFLGRDHAAVRLRGTWQEVTATCQRRHALASLCLDVLLAQLPAAKPRGAQLLVEFTFEQLDQAIDQDLLLRSQPSTDRTTELEHALLYLHRIGALVLHKGLAVFRQAMLLQVPPPERRRPVRNHDFTPLAEHQAERTVQIHIMHAFAAAMLRTPREGLRLLDDYFRLPRAAFLSRHLAQAGKTLTRPTTDASWRRIVGNLDGQQRRIVEAPVDRSLLVLAGPGSGKTRVVVHRCAYLLRVLRVPARALLVLCFNRSAALELRLRLRDLVGEEAHGVLVQTYHGLAARIAGRSPAALLETDGALPKGAADGSVFDRILGDAVDLLEAGNAAEQGDDLRERLLTGFQHILVDEYQDIDALQYRLVAAIAGRTLADPERKLTVLAVGDDDQNIYSFRGSNVEFLRRFATDYGAESVPLVANYRSTAHILEAAQALIAHNQDRLKRDHPLVVDDARAEAPAGGRFTTLDPVVQGRVHILQVADPTQQAHAVVDELQRLQSMDPDFTLERCAVLSPRHQLLDAVRTACGARAMPTRVRIDRAQSHSLFRLREVQELLAAVDGEPAGHITLDRLLALLDEQQRARPRESNFTLLRSLALEFGQAHGPGPHLAGLWREFCGEALLEQRRERTLGQGLLLATVHGCKGAEFDHVFVLDGGWLPRERDDWQERRRLYYVAMTRARATLTLVQCQQRGAPWVPQFAGSWLLRTTPPPNQPPPALRYEILGLGDLYLGHGGHDPQHEAVATATGRLHTGAPLQVVDGPRRLQLRDTDGQVVGELAELASAAWRQHLPQIRAARVAAILTWRRSDDAPEFSQRARRDHWSIVVPEITLDADPGP